MRASEPAAAKGAYGRLPLAFEANGGRTDERVDFIARGRGYALFLTPGESVLALGHGKRSAVLRTRLVGAAETRASAEGRLPGVVNSLIGRDRSRWRTGIPTYRKVRYRSVYPGTDLVYYGRYGRLEYDFVLAPGADPGRIDMAFRGASAMRVARNGDLILSTRAGALRQLRPLAYHKIRGKRQRVDASYVVRGRHVGLDLGGYERRRPLVIDPVLGCSTYLGGSGTDEGRGIAVGGDGSTYVTGTTTSDNFPKVAPYDSTRAKTDSFITKINPSGSATVYSTYIGGGEYDYSNAIAVNSAGNPYVTGQTSSPDFPTTTLDTHLDNSDAFVLKLTSTGAAVSWSTLLGGTSYEQAYGIAVNSLGDDVYVTGYTGSTDFPVSTYRYQGTTGGATDAFVAKLHSATGIAAISCIRFNTCLSRSYSSYIGGTGSDYGRAVSIDADGDAYVAGYTTSSAFPTKSAALANQTGTDAFASKFDTTPTTGATTAETQANSLVYSTYLGGAGTDYGYGIGVDSSESAYIVGTTDSTTLTGVDPTPPAPFTHVPSGTGDYDGYMFKLPAAGSPIASNSTIYFGGSGSNDGATGIAVHSNGTATSQYIVGETDSADFPVQKELMSGGLGNYQGFVLKYRSSSSPPAVFSTYLGGVTGSDQAGAIAVDSLGRAHVTGYAGNDFPRQNALQQLFGGGSQDAFVTRIDQRPPTLDPDQDTGNGFVTPADGDVIGGTDVEFWFHWDESNLKYFKCNAKDAGGHITSASRSTCTSPMAYSGLAEGAHTFQVVSVDDAYDESDPAEAQITFFVDLSAPPAFDLTEPANGATTDTQPTLKWQQSHDAGTPVSYHLIIDGTDVQQVAESACASDVCSAKLSAPLVTGPHTWKVRADDNGGHSTTSTSERTFTAVVPPAPKLTIAPNPALVGRDVTFDGTASADASHTITKYEWDLDGDGQYELDTGGAGTTTKAYPSAQTINVGLRVTDASGTSATTAGSLTITSLSGPALLGVTINNGAQYTRSPDVTVTATFPPSATQMLFSNDGGFLNATSFTPKVSQASVAPAGAKASSALARAAKKKSKKRKWKVKLKATDSNSGVATVQITSSKRKPGKALRYKRRLTVKSAKRPKWVRARDKAGNDSKWRKAR
jgi:hypothetical protein